MLDGSHDSEKIALQELEEQCGIKAESTEEQFFLQLVVVMNLLAFFCFVKRGQ
jgi:hypothetical protein